MGDGQLCSFFPQPLWGSLLHSWASGLTVPSPSVRMGAPGSGKAVNADGALDPWGVARELAREAAEQAGEAVFWGQLSVLLQDGEVTSGSP